MLVSKFNLKRKKLEYTGPEKLDSSSEVLIEIYGLKNLIKEAEARISAHEQVLLIAQEAEKTEK